VSSQLLRWSARFEIAIAIRKSNHAVGIGDVQEFRLVTWRIKSDSKRLVQIPFGEDFIGVGPAALLCIAQYPNLIGATFHDKDVAIGRGEQKTRVAKTAGVQVDLETRGNPGLKIRRTIDYAGAINRQNI
jgi:hypothetical protein